MSIKRWLIVPFVALGLASCIASSPAYAQTKGEELVEACSVLGRLAAHTRDFHLRTGAPIEVVIAEATLLAEEEDLNLADVLYSIRAGYAASASTPAQAVGQAVFDRCIEHAGLWKI